MNWESSIDVTIGDEELNSNRQALKTTLHVRTCNDFYTGLVAYILGLDLPKGMTDTDGFRVGWDTAAATPGYNQARYVTRAETAFGRIHVYKAEV